MTEIPAIPVELAIAESGKTLTIRNKEENASLDAAQVTRLILALGVARNSMLPQFPNLPPINEMLVLDEPLSYLMPDPQADGGILFLLDPAVGWRAFRCSHEMLGKVRTRIDEILGQGATAGRH